MAKQLCVICSTREASRQGEHVWPRWFLAHMDAQGSPKQGWSKNGAPILNSRGEQAWFNHRTRVQLPVCIECNSILGRRFEEPAREPILDLSVNRWLGPRTATEWQAVGAWWAKVGLMLGHPKARYSFHDVHRNAIRFDGDPPDYTWMVDGSPIPQDLSVFVYHCDMDAEVDSEATLRTPEHVAMADGSVALSHSFLIDTSDISVAVISHPGMTVRHPLVERGDAWELLRGAPDGGDLGSLPRFPRRQVIFQRGLRVHEGFQIDASETSRLLSIFPHDVEQAPEAYPTRPANESRRGRAWERFQDRLRVMCSRRHSR